MSLFKRGNTWWTSWLVQNGVRLYDLQEMGGREVSGHGTALCAPCSGPHGKARGGCARDACRNSRHKYGTRGRKWIKSLNKKSSYA